MIFLFFFGLTIGSFLNVLIDRLAKKESILGRSYCDHCRKTLHWHQLVPVLSFIVYRARCRYCQAKISIQYPLLELITGILFVLFGWGWNLIFVAILLVIFVYDAKYMLVPDIIAIPGMILALIISPENWEAAALSGGFFAFLVLISREKWMGWGDAEIAIIMGFLLGFPEIIFALNLAFVLGSIYGIILIAKKRRSLKSLIAFGPFLVSATIICLKFPILEKVLAWWNY